MASPALRALLVFAIAMAWGPLGGCRGEPIYGEVEGTVTLDGKPLAHVEVVFLPDPEKGNTGKRSVALTDARGRYRLASDGGRTGAPVGFHRVCINDLLAGPAGAAVRAGDDNQGPAGSTTPAERDSKRSRFPAAYSSAAATPLRNIEIQPGTQVIPLELKQKI